MALKITQVDAFTNKPFGGNPAAVCILPEPAEAVWMQQLAKEMNLSETAFLVKEEDGYGLRWFTPAIEVELCGHATLASAHVLWEEGYLQPDEQARFSTRSGRLTADRSGDWIELNFPAVFEEEATAPQGLVEALGAEPVYVGRHRAMDYIVQMDSEETVRNLKPNFSLLIQIETRGVIVTAASSSPEFDFVSRFFGPKAGINEDPVTGSAHCCLGPFWQKRLGKDTFTAYQASERGGLVKVRVDGDRIRLGGQAVTVLRGELVS